MQVLQARLDFIHVNNILAKLGVSDQTQATTLAIQWGLVRFE